MLTPVRKKYGKYMKTPENAQYPDTRSRVLGVTRHAAAGTTLRADIPGFSGFYSDDTIDDTPFFLGLHIKMLSRQSSQVGLHR